jgi:16S rRNA (guanine(527)-N(7))-methyltransferase RsmG
LQESEREHLVSGAATLGIELDSIALANFCRFADVLDLWSPRVNLISCRSAHELVERHFLDSLALASELPDTSPVVDLGTGAGFPGVPLAILKPGQRYVLVEARRRRAAYVREVRRTLELDNVEVFEGRAELPPAKHRHAAGVVLSRAVWADDALPSVAVDWLGIDGRLFWMRSQSLQTVPPPFVRERVLRYQIGGHRPRCVEILKVSEKARCFT